MALGPPLPLLVRPADLLDPRDQQDVIDLLDMYARDPFGQAAPLPEEVRRQLIPGLHAQAGALVLLAVASGSAVGLAVCFQGFSTFRARPLLNIHDLAVRPQWRGRGVGRALLQAAEEEARRRQCCKLTLEVRVDNHLARQLYRLLGFDSADGVAAEYGFWTKTL